MGKKSESRGKRRKRGGNTGVASQGDISLHLVCHGEGTTAEVATQNKEIRHTSMPMPPRTDGRVPGGEVQSTRGGEETSRERRNARMENTSRARQEREERASRTREKEED